MTAPSNMIPKTRKQRSVNIELISRETFGNNIAGMLKLHSEVTDCDTRFMELLQRENPINHHAEIAQCSADKINGIAAIEARCETISRLVKKMLKATRLHDEGKFIAICEGLIDNFPAANFAITPDNKRVEIFPEDGNVKMFWDVLDEE